MTVIRIGWKILAIGLAIGLAACADNASEQTAETQQAAAPTGERTAWVDEHRLINANTEPGNWLAHGRTYSEQRFSPLSQINKDTVEELGLAWSWDTGTTRGLEATPIVVDGVMYSTGTWSVTYAHDAATGELLWQHDPEVPREWAYKACCDVVNRGAAV